MKALKYIIIFTVIIILVLGVMIYSLSSNKVNNDNNLEVINYSTVNTNKVNNTNNYNTNNVNNSYNNVNNTIFDEKPKDQEFILTGNTEEVKSANSFYMVEYSIQEYINNITNKNANAIYNELSKEYIKNNNIDMPNVFQYVNDISEKQQFRALKMKYVQGEKCNQYGVYGKLLSESGKITEIYLIVNVNMDELSYSIIPQIKNEYTDFSQLKIKTSDEEITLTENNKATYKKISNEQVIDGIMADYQKNVLYDTKNAYKLLDYGYSKKRFSNYDDYFNYAKNKVEQIKNLQLTRYKTTEYSDYTEHECEDIYGNVYIIKATGIREYTIILDDYTLEKETYLTEYNTLENEMKAKVSINKFIKMINACDYSHAYSYLYDGFKETNFKTREDFENYVKQNFYIYNIVKEAEINAREDGIYIGNVKLKNGNNDEYINKTFIIKLGTGTNFEMSFEI